MFRVPRFEFRVSCSVFRVFVISVSRFEFRVSYFVTAETGEQIGLVHGLGFGVDRCKATWKRGFKIPWREAGPPTYHDDHVVWNQ